MRPVTLEWLFSVVIAKRRLQTTYWPRVNRQIMCQLAIHLCRLPSLHSTERGPERGHYCSQMTTRALLTVDTFLKVVSILSHFFVSGFNLSPLITNSLLTTNPLLQGRIVYCWNIFGLYVPSHQMGDNSEIFFTLQQSLHIWAQFLGHSC